MSPPTRRAAWPGLDGWVILALSVLVVGTWWLRARSGPDLHVGILVGLDVLYLSATWWRRR